jgi:hypothetical protein
MFVNFSNYLSTVVASAAAIAAVISLQHRNNQYTIFMQI